MSHGEIDAILRERRLAAMRAEEDQASHSSHRGHGYDPNQPRVPKGHTGGGQWTSTGGAPSIEPAAAEHAGPPGAMNVAAGWQPTRPIAPPGSNPPIPPDVWEEWRRHTQEGIKGLIDAWLRLLRRGGGQGGSRSTGGDGDKDECYDRWDREYGRCDMFLPFGPRYRDACRARANSRLILCYSNGGKPAHPNRRNMAGKISLVILPARDLLRDPLEMIRCVTWRT